MYTLIKLADMQNQKDKLCKSLFLKQSFNNLSYLGEILERYEEVGLTFEQVVDALISDPIYYNFERFSHNKELYSGQFEKFHATFLKKLETEPTSNWQAAYLLFLGVMGSELYSEALTSYLKDCELNEGFLHIALALTDPETSGFKITKEQRMIIRKRLESGEKITFNTDLLEYASQLEHSDGRGQYIATPYFALKKLHKVFGLKSDGAKACIHLSSKASYEACSELLAIDRLHFYVLSLCLCYESYVDSDNRAYYLNDIRKELVKCIHFCNEKMEQWVKIYDLDICSVDYSNITPDSYEKLLSYLKRIQWETVYYLFAKEDFYESLIAFAASHQQFIQDNDYDFIRLLESDTLNAELWNKYYDLIKTSFSKSCGSRGYREGFLRLSYEKKLITIEQIYNQYAHRGNKFNLSDDFAIDLAKGCAKDHRKVVLMAFYDFLKSKDKIASYYWDRSIGYIISCIKTYLKSYNEKIQKTMFTFLNSYYLSRENTRKDMDSYLEFVLSYQNDAVFKELFGLTDDDLKIIYEHIASQKWHVGESLYKKICQEYFTVDQLAERKYQKEVESFVSCISRFDGYSYKKESILKFFSAYPDRAIEATYKAYMEGISIGSDINSKLLQFLMLEDLISIELISSWINDASSKVLDLVKTSVAEQKETKKHACAN